MNGINCYVKANESLILFLIERAFFFFFFLLLLEPNRVHRQNNTCNISHHIQGTKRQRDKQTVLLANKPALTVHPNM